MAEKEEESVIRDLPELDKLVSEQDKVGGELSSQIVDDTICCCGFTSKEYCSSGFTSKENDGCRYWLSGHLVS